MYLVLQPETAGVLNEQFKSLFANGDLEVVAAAHKVQAFGDRSNVEIVHFDWLLVTHNVVDGY